MSGMPKPRLPYLSHEKSRHGRLKWYFRRGKGQRIRLPDKYGSKEFRAAYDAALEGKAPEQHPAPRAPLNSLEWLFEMYRGSAVFAALAAATRKQQNNIMRQVLDRAAESNTRIMVHHITPKVMLQGMDDRRNTPAAANNFLKTMRSVFKFAVPRQLADTNPTRDIPFIKLKKIGFPIWEPNDIYKFSRFHAIGTKARLAFDILYFTGLRRSDVVRVGHQHIRNEILEIRTEKTGTPVTLEVAPEFRKSIDATDTGDMTLLVTYKGTPFTKESFGNWFRKMCRDAGVDKSAHGVRKYAATDLANSCSTTHELMSVFGWTSSRMADLYTKNANRKKLGIQASKKLSREQK